MRWGGGGGGGSHPEGLVTDLPQKPKFMCLGGILKYT